MKIQVLYFAVLRELSDCSQEELECKEGSTVAVLFEQIEQKHPRLKGMLGRVAIAIDHEYASIDSLLKDGSELALLPPVAGGSGNDESSNEALLLQVRDYDLSLQEVIDLVSGGFGGAVVTFTGIVREQTGGRGVAHLEYEAYGEMAVKELGRIRNEILEKWPMAHVAIHHRTGHLKIGDSAVVIAACCPHRKEAFETCSYAIERLKERVPIWKREAFHDGTSWVGWGP